MNKLLLTGCLLLLIIMGYSQNATFQCYNGIATILIPTKGEAIVFAPDLVSKVTNPSGKEVVFSFTKEKSDGSIKFTCAQILNGREMALEVKLYALQEDRVVDSCNTKLLIQISENACKDTVGNMKIEGRVADRSGHAVKNVVINLRENQKIIYSATTDDAGFYSFNDFIYDSLSRPIKIYTVEAEDNSNDVQNGLSTVDLVLIQKHILGVVPFTNELDKLAADIDNSGIINVLDLTELRKVILQLEPSFKNNKSWRFIPEAFKNRFMLSQSFPIPVLINNSNEKVNFIGVKIGDVNR